LAKKKIRNIKSNNEGEIKSSITNLLLNIIIFLLAGLIIYMGFSLFMKFRTDKEIIQKVVNDPLPAEIIQVEVLNGCGVPGTGDRFKDFLRSKGCDVVNVENYINFNVEKTLVIDRIGNISNAKKIASLLGSNVSSVFPQLNDDYFVDVTVIIGKDYRELNPAKNY